MPKAKLISLILVISSLLTLISCAVGGGSENTDTVMTVGGEKINHDTYRYFYLNYKAEDPDATPEEIAAMTLDAIKQDVALHDLAEKYSVKLTKDDKKEIDAYIQSIIDEKGSEDAYYAYLSENHLTGDLFRHLYSAQVLETKLREHMYEERHNIIVSDDATVDKDIEENFMAAKQILIRNDEGDDIEENRALADELLSRAIGGEDFDTLISEYSEDTSAKENYVYHFTYGQMLLPFEEAVSATAEGQVCSYVAESGAGFHVVMRTPLDTEYINNNYELLRDAYKARRFNEIRQEYASGLETEYTESFDTLSFE